MTWVGQGDLPGPCILNDGQQSIMDKTLREKPMVDLIGQPTNDECVPYFDASADVVCAYLKDN